jgi:DNA-binding LacI/PurR family transcriptional regulator
VDLDNFSSARALFAEVRELGIQGFVVPAFEKPPQPAIDALLETLPAVAIGTSAYRPACPLIIPDDAHSVHATLDVVERAGYQRIGIALPQYFSAESEDMWLGAALARRYRRPELYSIPLLTYRDDQPEHLPAWVREQRPDCLVVLTSAAVRTLVKDGIEIPGQLALTAIRVWEGEIDKALSGLWTPSHRLVRSALDLLNSMVRSGTPGKAMAALTELVAAEWITGRTLLPMGTKAQGRVTVGRDGSLHWSMKRNRIGG